MDSERSTEAEFREARFENVSSRVLDVLDRCVNGGSRVREANAESERLRIELGVRNRRRKTPDAWVQ